MNAWMPQYSSDNVEIKINKIIGEMYLIFEVLQNGEYWKLRAQISGGDGSIEKVLVQYARYGIPMLSIDIFDIGKFENFIENLKL